MTVTKKSASTRMLNYFLSGYDITTNQARRRFGIVNVAARVAELRDEGYPIYTNRKNINGHKTFVYRLGTFPKKAYTWSAKRLALTAAAY